MPTLRQISNFYCEGSAPSRPPRLVPLKKWLSENHYSVNQLPRLLREKAIVAKKHKGRLYVAKNPLIEPLSISEYMSIC